MAVPELAHLELLAEVDALLAELRGYVDGAPDWLPARSCGALLRRLCQRADTLRVRLEMPLVVALLGGTGTGKSTLVNALAGDQVTEAGRERPTTRRPVVVARPGLSATDLGLDPASVEWVSRELPALRDLVLVDCPDADTTEEADGAGTNLARLRSIMPHCDVLLVASTQQKYRSARVFEELASAAPGVRLVFVQTHADTEDDIREDWRQSLTAEYATGEMFFVDSLTALADARAGHAPRGEFARLVDLLTRQLAGSAGRRIRRANFLDLCHDTLHTCRGLLDRELPAVKQLETALAEQRQRLSQRLVSRMQAELISSRRPWESRLLAEVASRWGTSPFALVLRASQGLSGLLSGLILMRVRSTAQLALWGAVEGGRHLHRRLQSRRAEQSVSQALAWTWDEGELRTAAIVLDGYAAEAGCPRRDAQLDVVRQQAETAGSEFLARTSHELQALVARLAERHSGPGARVAYEVAFLALLVLFLYRLGRNFFYDSWLASPPQPLYELSFFLHMLFWLGLWSALLVWTLSRRLAGGMDGELRRLAERWQSPATTAALFSGMDAQCHAIRLFRDQLERLDERVQRIRRQLETTPTALGHRVS